MKTIITLLTALIISINLNAQSLNLTGKVKDKTTSKEIAYCSVLMIQNDSIKHFAITDDNGAFSIPARPGNYNLVLRLLGYISDTIAVELSKNMSIGAISLQNDTKVLDDVIIKGESRKTLIDRDETIVTKKLRAGTATASDLLDKVKGVSYDRYNRSIKVDNETNVKLLINGLEKDQEYIKSINPNRIAKIEVIRDPSGKYGLEGYSSIINIKLKKNYVGQEVFINVQPVFDPDTKDKKYIMPSANTYSTYNYTRKSLNIYGFLWVNKGKLALNQSMTKEYKDGKTTIQESINDKDNFTIDNLNTELTLGADYQISSKHTVSFEGQIGGSPRNNSETNYQIINKDNGALLSKEEFFSTTALSSSDYSATAFYIGNISDNKSLNIDYTYGGSKSDSKTNFQYDKLSPISNEVKETGNYSKFNVEWNHTLNPKFSYQIGYGNTWKRTNSETFYSNNNSEYQYELSDLRNRAFLYGTWKVNKKVNIKTGIAVENSLPKLDNQKQSYWIYKPHLDVHFKATKWLDMKLKYRTDDNYPTLSEANPIEVTLDNFTVQKGNPSLKPATTHKTSLTAILLHGLASITAFYNQSNDYIAPVGHLRNDGVFEYSYDNVGGYKHKGIKFNFTIPFSKKIMLQNNATIYNSKMTYQERENSFNDWKAESQLMYIDGKSGMWAGLMLQKSNSKIITPQGYRQGNNDFFGIMAQKPFFNKKMSVMLLYMLPINGIVDYTQDTYIKTNNYTQQNTMDLNLIKNVVVLKVNYRFHKGKQIKSIKKNVKRETKKKKGGIF